MQNSILPSSLLSSPSESNRQSKFIHTLFVPPSSLQLKGRLYLFPSLPTPNSSTPPPPPPRLSRPPLPLSPSSHPLRQPPALFPYLSLTVSPFPDPLPLALTLSP